jgi:O-antigen/teichoic acid export membrane protein
MRLLTRALGVLPAGTLQVGAGLMVFGGAAYVHLALAGHSLSTRGMAAMSVLWSIVFLLGLGLFFPVEQELIRHVAARVAAGDGIAPVVRRATALAGGIVLVTLVPLAAAARPLADKLFNGDIAMVAALGTAFVALAAVSVSHGVLAGTGRFDMYGRQLATDGGLRMAFAVAVGAAGLHSPVLFALILTIAPLIAVILTLRPVLTALRPGPTITWKLMCRGLGLLIGSTLLAQLVVNIGVINAKLLSPGNAAVVGALLAAIILARVPLFVFASLQASLLPGLAGAVAADEQPRFRRLVLRGTAIVAALGLAGGLIAVVLGPWLVQVLFAAKRVLGPADFGWLAAGTLFYMLAMVLGQGAMALSHHRDLLFAWIAGTVVLAAVTAVPGEVRLRVEIAYAVSSLTVALTLALVLFARTAKYWGTSGVADDRMNSTTATAAPGGPR